MAEHTPEAIRAALHAAAAHVLSVAAVVRQRFGVHASGPAQRLTEMRELGRRSSETQWLGVGELALLLDTGSGLHDS
jgi:hypothetical protein